MAVNDYVRLNVDIDLKNLQGKVTEVNKVTNRLSGNIDRAENEFRKLNNAPLKKAQQSTQNLTKSFGSLRGAISRSNAILGGFVAGLVNTISTQIIVGLTSLARSFASVSAEVNNLRNELIQTEQSVAAGNARFEQLRQIANATTRDVEEIGRNFNILTGFFQGTAQEGQGVLDVLQGFSNQADVVGAQGRALQKVFASIGTSLGTGTVDLSSFIAASRKVRGILPAITAEAQELGITASDSVAELSTAFRTGGRTIDEFFNLIAKTGVRLGQFTKDQETAGDGATVLANNWKNLVFQFSATSKVGDSLSGTLRKLAEALHAATPAIVTISLGLINLVKGIVLAIDAIVRLIGWIINGLIKAIDLFLPKGAGVISTFKAIAASAVFLGDTIGILAGAIAALISGDFKNLGSTISGQFRAAALDVYRFVGLVSDATQTPAPVTPISGITTSSGSGILTAGQVGADTGIPTPTRVPTGETAAQKLARETEIKRLRFLEMQIQRWEQQGIISEDIAKRELKILSDQRALLETTAPQELAIIKRDQQSSTLRKRLVDEQRRNDTSAAAKVAEEEKQRRQRSIQLADLGFQKQRLKVLRDNGSITSDIFKRENDAIDEKIAYIRANGEKERRALDQQFRERRLIGESRSSASPAALPTAVPGAGGPFANFENLSGGEQAGQIFDFANQILNNIGPSIVQSFQQATEDIRGPFDRLAAELSAQQQQQTQALQATLTHLNRQITAERRTIQQLSRSNQTLEDLHGDLLAHGFIDEAALIRLRINQNLLRIDKKEAEIVELEKEVRDESVEANKNLNKINETIVNNAKAAAEAQRDAQRTAEYKRKTGGALRGVLGFAQLATSFIPGAGPLISTGLGIIGNAALSSQGYNRGGYTGSGPSNNIAGYVHRGEFVVPQRETSRVLDGQTLTIGNPQQPIVIQNYLDSELLGEFVSTPQGEQAVMNILSRNNIEAAA